MSTQTIVSAIIDTHCHLDFSDFDADREDVLSNCIKLGVQHLVIPAVSAEHFARTIQCCNAQENLHLALGLHPVFIDQHQPQHLVQLNTELKKNSAIAVGEIGLDFYLKNLDKEKQIVFFSKQLIIAKQHQLPVIIHNRKAHDKCINLLREHGVTGGIIHAFNGSLQQARHYIELGFKLGFGGMLTYEHSNKLRNLAKEIPLEAIVLETDAPDMSVAQHKGQRNSPEYLPYIAQTLAQIRSESLSIVAQQTSQNAKEILKLSDS